MNDLVRSIDGNYLKNPIGYCKTHHGHLSLKQVKLHQCTQKHCTGFQKIDCPYWEEHQRKKELAKARKKQYG